MHSPSQGNSRWYRLSPALAVAALSLLLLFAGVFRPLDDDLATWRAELLSRSPSAQVVIIEIDARSLAELRSWPWPRSYHANVIRQIDRAGASIIAFDIDFSASSGRGDQELGRAIRDAGHVILPIFQQRASRAADEAYLTTRPDQELKSAWVGAVNIFPDPDGTVRNYPAASAIGGSMQPSIATLLAENHSLADRIFQPDWAIQLQDIPRLSFVDVMKGRFAPTELRGKRVLIGATAIELGDRYPVPRYGVVPGVEIQAMAAESLLQQRAIIETSPIVTCLVVLLIAWLVAPGSFSNQRNFLACSALVMLAIIAGPLLLQIIWPVSVDSGAWLFTFIAGTGAHFAVEARRRLRMRAETDPDSGLPNRLVLERDLRADDLVVAAAIERFEAVRDGAGHAALTEMVVGSAAQIAAISGARVHRVAPDALAWVLPAGSDVTAVLERIRAAFRSAVTTSAGPIDVLFTFGSESSANSPVIRVEHALAAIGQARSVGHWHEQYQCPGSACRRQLSMMSDLRQAMSEGRVRLFYQPKLNLSTGRIGDAEALIRWSGRDGEMIMPDDFIPLAESTGAIHELTIFALRSAIGSLAAWAGMGRPFRIAVNVSALDLGAPDFVDTVRALLEASGVAPSALALEVTEGSLIRSSAEAARALAAFRDVGVRLSVDDYGTGHSTLSYLKYLPVHELKIDRSFITNLVTSDSDRIMVRSTIDLAHDLGLEVVAEGIEDEATLNCLKDLGCDYAQGYFISRPIDEEKFLATVGEAPDRRVA